jgi:hypothetical protein
MVWVDNWETFYAEAEKLYIEHPDHVRATLSPPMIARNRSHPHYGSLICTDAVRDEIPARRWKARA